MLGMFCGTHCTNNEDYKKELKKRMFIYAVLFVVGCIVLSLSLVANQFSLSLSPIMEGLYAGAGVGLIAASLLLTLRNWRLLHNEERLKKVRIEASDERNQTISLSASKAAIFILMITMLLTIFIAGLWDPTVSIVLAYIMMLFFVSYYIAYFIFSKRN